MNDWLTFEGTAEKVGSTYKLTDRDANGTVIFELEDVQIDRARVRVRRGAVALAREFSSEADERTRTKVSITGDTSPEERTYCLGSLEFRCMDDRLMGPCMGFWNCTE